MNDNYADLDNRITALEKWKTEKEGQQIKFPLDVQSIAILNKYFMRIDDLINYEVVGASGHTIYLLLGNQDSQPFQLSPQTIFPYTVDVASNQLTVKDNNLFATNTAVHLNTTAAGTLPAPLAVNTSYYVKSLSKKSTGSVFVLSATPGGATINITTTGTGPQYIEADT